MSQLEKETPFTSKQRELSVKQVKIQLSDAFKRDHCMLSTFITQLKIYICFNQTQLAKKSDKVFFVLTYLRGDTFNWFKSTVRDYIENTKLNHKNLTNKIFSDFKKFKSEIRIVFEEIDEVCTAEREIFHL